MPVGFRIVLMTLLFFTGQLVCRGQFLFAPQNKTPQQIVMGLGIEPEWTATLGYTHQLGKAARKVTWQVGGRLKVAPLIIKKAWRASVVNAVQWSFSEKWKTNLSTDIYLAYAQNRAGKLHGLGGELRAIPAYYGKNWVKGIDVGWQHTAFTHLRHSAATKETFAARYPNGTQNRFAPKDGWYGATAHRFRLGFAGERKLSKHLKLQIAAGSMLSVQKQGILIGFSHAQVPFYLETACLYHW